MSPYKIELLLDHRHLVVPTIDRLCVIVNSPHIKSKDQDAIVMLHHLLAPPNQPTSKTSLNNTHPTHSNYELHACKKHLRIHH